MMNKLISDQHGEALALEVANQMLHHPVRSAETPQRDVYKSQLPHRSGRRGDI